MAETKINYAKFETEKSLQVKGKRIENDKSITKIDETFGREVHPDLKKSFDALIPHLIIIGEFLPASSIKSIDEIDADVIKQFRINGLSVKGDEGDETLIMMGGKTLSTGKYLGINTPLQRLTDDYKFIDDLEPKLKTAISEIIQYVNGEKKAEDPQQELNFDAPVTHIQILNEESQEEKDEAILKKLRGGIQDHEVGDITRAAENGNEDAIGGAVNEMVQEQRDLLKGKGKKKLTGANS